MSFYDRLLGKEEPRIPEHLGPAIIAELLRGYISVLGVHDVLNVTEAEEVDFAEWVARFTAQPDPLTVGEFADILTLGVNGIDYFDDYTLRQRLLVTVPGKSPLDPSRGATRL